MDQPRVLVIEDDQDTNELICVVLSHAGFQTVSAYDGIEGLEKAEECMPDIIILDVMMPRMDGISVCRALKKDEKRKNIPVIMLTAKQELQDKLVGFISGASRYIVKPFDLVQFANVVETVLAQHKRDANGHASYRNGDAN